VFASCPDYAPDRRHFVSLADDLADRDLPDALVDAETLEQVEVEVADLFRRVYELIAQQNLDASRSFAIEENAGTPAGVTNPPGLPQVDARTMTKADQPYAREVPDLQERPAGESTAGVAHDRLPYALAARLVHAPLTDVDLLIDFLRSYAARVRGLMRPPFGRFWQLDVEPGPLPARDHRDPRVMRDTMQDMRMPPYMRDSDENPLSLTWRQYRELMDLVDYLDPDGARERHHGPRRRAVRRLVERIGRSGERT
jgi:hypothetical protein